MTLEHKFGLIGTSCAGKTTLAYDICGNLKREGVNADGVFQQDRRLPFDRKYLEEEIGSQFWVVLNQAVKEIEFVVGRPPKVLVSDRSVLDFYAYLSYQYDDSILEPFVREWVETYDMLYYLEPLNYEDDGARPDDTFRKNVNEELLSLIDEWGLDEQVKFINREDVYDDIKRQINRTMSESELKKIPHVLDVDSVLLAGSYARGTATVESDVDIYLKGDTYSVIEDNELLLKRTFGVEFDVTAVKQEMWDSIRNSPDSRIITRSEKE